MTAAQARGLWKDELRFCCVRDVSYSIKQRAGSEFGLGFVAKELREIARRDEAGAPASRRVHLFLKEGASRAIAGHQCIGACFAEDRCAFASIKVAACRHAAKEEENHGL